MANNRLYLVCEECNSRLLIAKSYGEWYLCIIPKGGIPFAAADNIGDLTAQIAVGGLNGPEKTDSVALDTLRQFFEDHKKCNRFSIRTEHELDGGNFANGTAKRYATGNHYGVNSKPLASEYRCQECESVYIGTSYDKYCPLCGRKVTETQER